MHAQFSSKRHLIMRIQCSVVPLSNMTYRWRKLDFSLYASLVPQLIVINNGSCLRSDSYEIRFIHFLTAESWATYEIMSFDVDIERMNQRCQTQSYYVVLIRVGVIEHWRVMICSTLITYFQRNVLKILTTWWFSILVHNTILLF